MQTTIFPLDDEERRTMWQRVKRRFTRTAHMLEGITLVLALFGAGWGSAMWWLYQDYQDDVALLRADYQSAVDQLAEKFDGAIERLVPKVEQAAENAENAAEKADEAVSKAGAISERKPTVVVRPVVTKSAAPAVAPKVDQINRSVQNANRTIGGK